jgi:hypothetical protein
MGGTDGQVIPLERNSVDTDRISRLPNRSDLMVPGS